ncbi:50S ribosomal protein L25 [Candidatus Uhrbacteria bacterium]|nr:50S ribosomal protein L25 [Candidatus Uhrbacteria bacterium]
MIYALSAKARTSMGKRAKDELADMRVPAVMYGSGVTNQNVSVPRSEFLKVFKQAGYSSLVDIAIGDASPIKAVIKEVQVHPLSMEPIHIDFHQVRMDQEMEAVIPLKFIGESNAVKADAGTLIKSLDEVEVRCLPADLPHALEIDLSKLATFEDSITTADIKLPKGVELVTVEELTIATVQRPMTEEELKKLEESQVGDVTAVKSEADLKKAADEAKAAEEAAAKEAK